MNWRKLLERTETVRLAVWDVVLRVVKAKVDQKIEQKEDPRS